MSSTDTTTIYASHLLHALQHPTPAGPFQCLGPAHINALKKLTKIFNTATSNEQPETLIIAPSPLKEPSYELLRVNTQNTPTVQLMKVNQSVPITSKTTQNLDEQQPHIIPMK